MLIIVPTVIVIMDINVFKNCLHKRIKMDTMEGIVKELIPIVYALLISFSSAGLAGSVAAVVFFVLEKRFEAKIKALEECRKLFREIIKNNNDRKGISDRILNKAHPLSARFIKYMRVTRANLNAFFFISPKLKVITKKIREDGLAKNIDELEEELNHIKQLVESPFVFYSSAIVDGLLIGTKITAFILLLLLIGYCLKRFF